MPRYYFDVNDGIEHRDDIGRELEAGVELRRETLHVVTELMKLEADDAKDTTLVISVREEAGNIPLKVRMVCQVEET